MLFKEDLLQFIWKYKLFNTALLLTEDGQPVEIIDVGRHNSDAGPDFEFAKIKIGTYTWSGNVEVHMIASDWSAHKHQNDPLYDNTILHVIWCNSDKVQLRSDGSVLPVLVLQKFVDKKLLQSYERLMISSDLISCENSIQHVSSFVISNWLDRMVIEKWQKKYLGITTLLNVTHDDWERVLMVSIARSLGMKVNAEVFEKLMLKVDFSLLQKYRTDALKVEAILFGQAGFLHDNAITDSYYLMLKKEYTYLKNIHNLQELQVFEWKFMRMRPYNFPTYRLAQLASLIQDSSYWFHYLIDSNDLEVLKRKLEHINLNSYWLNHFRFGTETINHSVIFGSDIIHNVLINSIIPVLFCYGKHIKNDAYQEKSLLWLEQVSPEKNTIIKKFKSLGVSVSSAVDTQGLIHLKNNYCDAKKCLSCAIGHSVLKIS